MDLQQLLSYPWRIMLPEFTILGMATLLSLLDLFLRDKVNRNLLGWLALGGVGLAALFVIRNMVELSNTDGVLMILFETYRLDGFSSGFKLIFLAATALVFLLSLDYAKARTLDYKGEYYYLILTALLGAMLLTSSADMITMFVGLELLSLSSYILVAVRKKNLQSNESAFKYIVSGGMATAIMLYGMSFIYGVTGTTNLMEMASYLSFAYNEGYELIIYFGFFLTLVGLAFKIAVVPFHMWTPDVYQGAATPIAAFLSVVSKAAGFAFILRLFLVAYLPIGLTEATLNGTELIFFDLTIMIGLIAAATMIIGNVMALRQTNVKRLFAYSSVAQAGYILVPLAALSQAFYATQGHLLDTMLFYLIAYLFMNLGAFAIMQMVTQQTGSENIKAFAGLYHRSPVKAWLMTLFLIALAGLPLTGGFMGKLLIFMITLEQGVYWLAGILVITTVISYFYYFAIMRQMFMRGGESERPLSISPVMWVIILICAVGTLAQGFLPTQFMTFIHEFFHISQIWETGLQNQ